MTLDELRAKIDSVDNELCALFTQRLELAALIAEEKKKSGKAVFDPQRENAILEKISSRSGSHSEEAVRLYREIFAISRDCQNKIIKK